MFEGEASLDWGGDSDALYASFVNVFALYASFVNVFALSDEESASGSEGEDIDGLHWSM